MVSLYPERIIKIKRLSIDSKIKRANNRYRDQETGIMIEYPKQKFPALY